jgi:hypothetical protein
MLCASVNMKMANDFLLMFQFDKIDKDGNGTIDIDEFVGALLPGVAKQVRHTACIQYGLHMPRGYA